MKNNATASAPMVIEQPPPTDLQVTAVDIPTSARTGELVEIEWTVTNAHERNAGRRDVDRRGLPVHRRGVGHRRPADRPRAGRSARRACTWASYTSVLEAALPPAAPGQYRIIVRADIFNEVLRGGVHIEQHGRPRPTC
jgi:hypothetical protein